MCDRASCRDILIKWQENLSEENLSEYLEEVPEEDRSLQFVNEWLTAVTDYTVGLFLVQIMTLKYLSCKGCFQLSADIGYLINVSSALGIPPHPLLLHFRDIFANGKLDAVKLLSSTKLTAGTA